MLNQRANKIAARALAASLFVVGSLATNCLLGVTPACSMDQNSWAESDRQWQDCFSKWDEVSNKWTEEAKAQEGNNWKSVQKNYGKVREKWQNVDQKRKFGNSPNPYTDMPNPYTDMPNSYTDFPNSLYSYHSSTPNRSPLFNPYEQINARITISPINNPIILINPEIHFHIVAPMPQNLFDSNIRSLNMVSSFAKQHRDYCTQQFSAHMAGRISLDDAQKNMEASEAKLKKDLEALNKK